MKLKVDFIREQFSAFSDNSLKRWLHFENAGGSYMCKDVENYLTEYYQQRRIQPGYFSRASQRAATDMESAYKVMGEILNTSPESLYIGASTSMNFYTLSNSFAEIIPPSANIIVTNQDHEANTGFWRKLSKHGVEIREWQVDALGKLHKSDLEALIDDKTYFAAFPHVSNILGEINPVQDICKILRDRNVISIVDGVSYAPHSWPNLAEFNADIYAFSTYKTYGPHQGVLFIQPELAQKLANQGHNFNNYEPHKRLNPAGPDHAQVASLSALGGFIEKLSSRHKIKSENLSEKSIALSKLQREREALLLEPLMAEIAEFQNLKLLGSKDLNERVPTISFVHKDKNGRALAKDLAKFQIMAGGGHFYSPRLLQSLGIAPEHGVLRVSFLNYTRKKEIASLIKALKKIDKS